MRRESTVQQLDPVGGRAAGPLTVSAGIAMVAFAVAQTVLSSGDIERPVFAIIAISIVVVIACLLVYSTAPLRAPVTASTHVTVVVLALVAMAVAAASTGASNSHLRDDWGAPVIGLVCLAMCPYRPPRELAAVGSLAAIFAGLIVLVQVDAMRTVTPPFVFVIIAITPILALCLGGAVFSSVLIRMMRRWQSRASVAVRAIASQQLEGITRSVQQDHVTILNRDVVPFFAEVLTRSDITERDRDRAREISDSIRTLMVAEMDRSWLDVVLEQIGAAPSIDPTQVAVAMNLEQRSALRAALVAIGSHPGLVPHSLTVDLHRSGVPVTVVVAAAFDRPVRDEIEPYLAVLRVFFSALSISYSKPTLTVRFSYEHR